tara:strand:- start:4056 stop:4496 length:441 start_codon:yes stop_codon:yes gene_type:complete
MRALPRRFFRWGKTVNCRAIHRNVCPVGTNAAFDLRQAVAKLDLLTHDPNSLPFASRTTSNGFPSPRSAARPPAIRISGTSHSPEAVDALLDVWPIFEAFQLTYVSKGLLLEQEKNASALSPNGPSAGASATAKPVRKPARTARRG